MAGKEHPSRTSDKVDGADGADAAMVFTDAMLNLAGHEVTDARIRENVRRAAAGEITYDEARQLNTEYIDSE